MIRPYVRTNDWICIDWYGTGRKFYFGRITSQTTRGTYVKLRMIGLADHRFRLDSDDMKYKKFDNLGPNPYDLEEIS